MSVLILEVLPRARLGPQDDASPPPADWTYAWSADGRQVSRQGRAAAALLPRADTVVAVLATQDVGWHRITLPRAPAARLRAALAGTLEDQLLDEPEAVHFALPPKAPPGEATWVAVVRRRWLAELLGQLEGAGVIVDRVVPRLWPGAPPHGCFSLDGELHGEPSLRLDLADEQGVRSLRLVGTLARQVLPGEAAGAAFAAEPGAAAAAERWLGRPVAIRSPLEQALLACEGPWNLRQFDLLPRARGARWLRDAVRALRGPKWRVARWGAAAIAAVHLVGLNAWAWQLSRQAETQREAANALLRSSFPEVRTVLDAPVQMERETERLRARAGRIGDTDLEALLAVAAQAWPDGMPPAQTFRFEAGRLSLSAQGLGQEQLGPLRERLRALGYDAEWSDGQIHLFRGAGRPSS